MKKVILSLIACLGLANVSEAQVKLSIVPRVGASFGNMLFTNALTSNVTRYSNPQPGISISNPTGAAVTVSPAPPAEFRKLGFRSRLNDQYSRVGFTGGVGLNISVNEHFSVQPELLFVQKGASYFNNNYVPTVDSVTNLNKETHIKLNYLELPVIARYDFGFGEKCALKGYIGGGMSVGVALNGTYKAVRYYQRNAALLQMSEEGKILFGSPSDSKEYAANNDRYFDNRVEFGAIGVIGLQYPLGNGFLVADVRYNVAINNLYKKDSQFIPAGFDNVSKNRVAQFTLGYMLPLGGEAATAPSTGKKRR